MTPEEIQTELQKLFEQFDSPNAYVSMTICRTGDPAHISCYPEGICKGPPITSYASTFEQAFSDICEKISRELPVRRQSRTKELALEIIRITAEKTYCCDTDLRQAGFTTKDLEHLGTDAENEAERISQTGPFQISYTPGSNAN